MIMLMNMIMLIETIMMMIINIMVIMMIMMTWRNLGIDVLLLISTPEKQLFYPLVVIVMMAVMVLRVRDGHGSHDGCDGNDGCDGSIRHYLNVAGNF